MEEKKYEYLSMVAMLYESGIWDEKTVIKRVQSYASDNNIDSKIIEEFLGRLIKKKEEKKEHTKEEKMAFLSALRFNNGELKYGDAVNIMSDDMIERYYDFESKSIGEEETEKLHERLKGTTEKEKTVSEGPKKEELKSEPPKQEEQKPETPVNGEYSMKGGERTVIGGNSAASHTTPNNGTAQTSNAQESSGPRSEPETEEDYENTARNMGSAEQDSNVRHVDASAERVERLKKGKGRAKSFFLKAGIVVLTVMMTSSFSIPLIGGYLILAHQIKEGKFNPPGAFGQGIKNVVEKIMNVGKTKEQIAAEKAERAARAEEAAAPERGRSR